MAGSSRLWHVTLTVGGEPWDGDRVRAAMERLTAEQPFLLSGRYGVDRAEISYWEEAADCADAIALALRLWGEHRLSADLPPWRITGVEVVERELRVTRGGEVAVLATVPGRGWIEL